MLFFHRRGTETQRKPRRHLENTEVTESTERSRSVIAAVDSGFSFPRTQMNTDKHRLDLGFICVHLCSSVAQFFIRTLPVSPSPLGPSVLSPASVFSKCFLAVLSVSLCLCSELPLKEATL